MTPHSHALTMENQADMLAEALWELRIEGPFAHGRCVMDPNTRKAIRRTIEILNMILEGDIRSPLDMAAKVEGRVDEN